MKIAPVVTVTITILLLQQVYAGLPPKGYGFVYIIAELGADNDPIIPTGYYKIGATGMGVPSIVRSQLNAGNPRRLEMVEFTRVSATREAKANVQEAVVEWKISRGKDWYYVPIDQAVDFLEAFEGAV